MILVIQKGDILFLNLFTFKFLITGDNYIKSKVMPHFMFYVFIS